MKKRKKSIYELVKERFGTNVLYDEKFSKRGYWESVPIDEDGEAIEDYRANPDDLLDTFPLGKDYLEGEAAEKFEAIVERLQTLEQSERDMILMCADGASIQNAATKLGLTKLQGQRLLDKARAKIKKFYMIRKARLDP